MTDNNLSEKDLEEKMLRDSGWKIHHKDEGKKFWESPYDNRVYSTAHAVMVEESAAIEKRQKKLADEFAAYEKFDLFAPEYDVDVVFPPPSKKIKKKKKTNPSTVQKNLKDLGY